MKFGDHLQSKIYEPWRHSYIQYNVMKQELKQKQLEGWNTNDEHAFSKKIESELVKVYQFIDRGLCEIARRVEQSTALLDAIKGNKQKKKYDRLADTLTEILFDTNDLSKFHQLNVTGFLKLLKKHDKHTGLDLQSVYRSTMSHQWPLDKMSLQFDVLVVRISELHDTCYLHGNKRSEDYTQGGDQTAFERATAKYWIHPDHITEVKSIILFHLPVHVFNPGKSYEESDMAVSSVYFDNPHFDLYTERLHRLEGAESIRLRWYSHLTEANNSVYVERKTHKAAWLDGKSVKDRFRLKENQVDSFLCGNYSADQLADDLRSKSNGKRGNDGVVDENHFIASGVQRSVEFRDLHPVCRVFYNRTAFQLPGDQRLRISLDANLTFIREDGKERRSPSQIESMKLHWKRNDIGIDYPFRSVPGSDISHFPYAVLETKLQSHLGQECPVWLRVLLDSHLVHEVPRFSKYIHGASVLFSEKVPIAPYWLSEFDKDIRQAPMANIGLSRSLSFKPLVNGHHRRSLLMLHEKDMNPPTSRASRLFNKSKSLGDLHLMTMGRKKKNAHLSIDFKEEEDTQPPKKDVMNRLWGASGSALFSRDEKISRIRSSPSKLYREQVKKVEPKTFFANERTFISWLQFCALLLTVALNLLNNGDRISRIIGAIFIVMASLLSFYALIRFQLRSWQLRTNNHIVRYDDVYGPTVLCVLLVSALVINFYLRADTLSASFIPPKV